MGGVSLFFQGVGLLGHLLTKHRGQAVARPWTGEERCGEGGEGEGGGGSGATITITN